MEPTESRLEAEEINELRRGMRIAVNWSVKGKNMKTLADLIRQAKIRTGKADGVTERGAYWEPNIGSVTIRSYGGDGIGESSASVTHTLHVRHYRDNDIEVVVRRRVWHQNDGPEESYEGVSGILGCTNIEDVITYLCGSTIDGVSAYHSYGEKELTRQLRALGLPYAPISPDDRDS